MKKILKLSLVSLCASGAVLSTQAHDNQSASNNESDKQLTITEPAGADSSANSAACPAGQTSSTSYQSYQSSAMQGQPMMQGQQVYESAGAAPGLVTGREQDAYADCILHQYQLGKGSARVTDEHYWNNVPADRLYAQYPGSAGTYQNYAYTSYGSQSSYSSQSSYGSQPMESSSASSSTYSSQPSASMSTSMQGDRWYAPGGRIYNSQGALISGPSGAANEPAGAPAQSGGLGQQQSGSYGAQSSAGKSSAEQSGSLNAQSSGPQPSATQPGTSGAQSSTELKGQNQPGSATQEAAGAQPSTSSSTESSTQPSSTSSSEQSTQPSSTATSPEQSTQSSTGTAAEGMSEKVRSSLKSDTTLSPMLSNVQIQDQNGKVALSGTVKSEAEKQQIVSKAEETAGSGNVIDNLQVQSDSNSGSSNPSSNPNQ